MIRHIVFFSARDKADIPAIVAGLGKLADIPHSRHFEVRLNGKVDPMGNDVDVVVYAEFDDQQALAAYKADPIYAESTRTVRPMREIRYSADFEA